jgi:hypothetical protein
MSPTHGATSAATSVSSRNSAGASSSPAFFVEYFDSIGEMENVYDQCTGHSGLQVSEDG